MAESNLRIIDFHPALAQYFRALNVEWLQRDFTREPIEHEVLVMRSNR
jgi:hypothetical protein